MSIPGWRQWAGAILLIPALLILLMFAIVFGIPAFLANMGCDLINSDGS